MTESMSWSEDVEKALKRERSDKFLYFPLSPVRMAGKKVSYSENPLSGGGGGEGGGGAGGGEGGGRGGDSVVEDDEFRLTEEIHRFVFDHILL